MLMARSDSVVCLQETHFLPIDRYDFSIPRYSVYNAYSDTNRRQGGVSVYVKNDLPHFQVALNTNLQAVACSVKMGHTRICVCSLYLPPNDTFTYHELNNLVAELPSPFLICTDSNSRHFLWGADRCDSRGNVWERIIQRHTLKVMNDGSPTRMDEFTGLWSHIDVTVTSSSVGQYMHWYTDTDLHSSDHLPLYITYDRYGNISPQRNIFIGWNLNKAKWTDFADKCDLRFDENEGMGNYQNITMTLMRAAKEVIPQKNSNSKYS